jgi:hypothetical protein
MLLQSVFLSHELTRQTPCQRMALICYLKTEGSDNFGSLLVKIRAESMSISVEPTRRLPLIKRERTRFKRSSRPSVFNPFFAFLPCLVIPDQIAWFGKDKLIVKISVTFGVTFGERVHYLSHLGGLALFFRELKRFLPWFIKSKD